MTIETRNGGDIIESVIIQGDLGKLTPEQRTTYYAKVCESLGLNPYTKPFDYIRLNGAMTLYARRDAADQLRKIHGVSLTIVSREKVDDLYIVTAKATDAEGRSDESTGVVSLAGLKGDALANALMKAETKAKRRVTLSLVGLGWLDETEIETIPDARVVEVDATPAQVEAPKADANGRTPLPQGAQHWIENPKARAAFWAWTGGEMALSNPQVYEALGVESIHDYRYSMRDAKTDIEAWVEAESAGEDVEDIGAEAE